MSKPLINSLVVSTDSQLRAELRTALAAFGCGVAAGGEIGVPLSQLGAAELAQLRKVDPGLVILDVEESPALGIRFAQYLADTDPHRRVVATGPSLGPEMLLEAMRAGISEYLPKPVSREALEQALRRIERKLQGGERSAPRAPGQLFATFGAKGGAGTTTVATNLAIHFHQLTGKRTLLVDLDLDLGEVATLLGAQPRFSVLDMVRNFHRMDENLLDSYIERHSSGIHLLPAPINPEPSLAATQEALGRVLGFLKQHYDYLVVDTPKGLSPATLAALETADRVLLVTTVDLPSLHNIKRWVPILERAVGLQAAKVRLVVNRYQASDPITLEEVQRTLALDVAWTLSNDYSVVMRSINAAEPAVLAGRSAFARDLMRMGSDLTGVAAEQGRERAAFSTIRKLFSRTRETIAYGPDIDILRSPAH